MNELQGGAEEQEKRVEQRRQQIKQKAAQYLTKEARSRLGNVRTANAELASAVEMQIARMGEMGQIQKLDDDRLKKILKQLQQEKQEDDSDIKFRR